MLIGDAVLVLVDVYTLVGSSEDLASTACGQHATCGGVDVCPCGISWLAVIEVGRGRVCSGNAKCEAGDRLDPCVRSGDAVSA